MPGKKASERRVPLDSLERWLGLLQRKLLVGVTLHCLLWEEAYLATLKLTQMSHTWNPTHQPLTTLRKRSKAYQN